MGGYIHTMEQLAVQWRIQSKPGSGSSIMGYAGICEGQNVHNG
jgi:hypothetical protein